MGKERAVLIAGPTASGKSALAIDLADRLGGVIVNADSMQVYRDLRVLTARPTPAEEARVPHRLYGFVPAAENYSVGRWLLDARSALEAAEGQGRPPIFVGGTGLYFKALLDGLSPVPDVPASIREQWRARARTMTPAALHAALAERDPAMARRLRPSDPQRVARALEVLEATGRSLSAWQAEPGRPLLEPASTLRIVLAPERAALAARIDARFDEMIEAGAVDEVAALAALNLNASLPAMRAHGVRPVMAYLAGGIGLEEAGEATKGEIRRYAKRQLTWARRFMADWHWVESGENGLSVLTAAAG